MELPDTHQAITNRFVAACQADQRIVAAFLRGSYVTGTADAYSDLDLGLITTDEGYPDFIARRMDFVRQLGEPVFLESFNLPNVVFFVFSDGTEGELAFGPKSEFAHIHEGPYKILLDQQHVLEGTVFSGERPAHAEQLETLRRLIYWFWHELAHVTTALGRFFQLEKHWLASFAALALGERP